MEQRMQTAIDGMRKHGFEVYGVLNNIFDFTLINT